MNVEIYSRNRCVLAESPIWDGKRLLYLDLAKPAVIEISEERGELRYPLASLPAPLGGLCLLGDGGFGVGSRKGLIRIEPSTFEVSGVLVPPDASFEAAPPNDMGVHPGGHLIMGTADAAETAPSGGVFLCSTRRPMRRLAGGYTVSNGPAFSPDGQIVYLADSPKGLILAYDWCEDSLTIGNKRTFQSSAPGLPDGLAVDADGGVWSARWGGGCVVRYRPDGREDLRIALPAKLITSCTFGDTDMRTLFITTASSPEGDGGGYVYRVAVGVPGIPSVSALL